MLTKYSNMRFSMFFWVVKFDCFVTKRKKRIATFTKDFVRKKLPNLPHFEGKKVQIAILRLKDFPCHHHIVGIQKILLFFLSCSQIWLNSLVEESLAHLPHKIERKKRS